MPKILVVDDDGKIRNLLADLLEGRYRVETRASPLAALEALRDFQPDVVVVDYHMPEMNGMEVLRHVKSVAPTTEVIMITGMAEVQLAEEAYRLGAFAYLPKPFQMAYADHLIHAALQHKTG